MNESGWRDVWERASALFAQESHDFQLIVLLAALVLAALILQAISPLFFIRRERVGVEDFVPAPQRMAQAPQTARPQPVRTAPKINRRRKVQKRKRFRAAVPRVNRTGALGIVAAPPPFIPEPEPEIESFPQPELPAFPEMTAETEAPAMADVLRHGAGRH